MSDRVARLRGASLAAEPSISIERALLLTELYRADQGRWPAPLLRARAFHHLCARKTLYLGPDELIVGERGPAPKATPTYPEITCHSVADLEILGSRPLTSYRVAAADIERYAAEVIPYWRGRTLRECALAELPAEWHAAYSAGVFTEFMEQRAPGHTVADGKIYRAGMVDLQRDIDLALARLGEADDPATRARRDQLRAMRLAADAAIVFARRHAELARRLAKAETEPVRRSELERIAEVCDRVPAHPPRDFHEALQAYWFVHLGVITELNGWDAFNPGHLDQHLGPFYERGLADGSLTRERAKELLGCFFVKFNNHPAPPKVGVTAAESGTYTDFANINLGGLTRDGRDGVNEVSFLLLEVIDELHLLQPSNNIQVSAATPEPFLRAALGVVRKGYGFPSLFNADAVVAELVAQGKTVEDAREGGTSGCVEAGAFGKEAYILTGYFNLPKLLELALHDGVDPRTGDRLGPRTGDPAGFGSLDEVFAAWRAQVDHFVGVKIRGNHVWERAYAETAPAPFLSLLIDDCIATGRDYNAGGARYNTSYIQGVGIGSLTDSLSAIGEHVFTGRRLTMAELVAALDADFAGHEPLRRRLLDRTPKYGNDDDRADDLMVRCFEAFHAAVDGRPNGRGGTYHVDMLPTTCHVYFGSVIGALPDGRRAGRPLSEGISPVQGADRKGPTAVFRSAAKMDHLRTGGTLLNQKLTPGLLEGEGGIDLLAGLVRGYFGLAGHHVQFNVVSADTLRAAQADPDAHRGLIVRVAGYSDYFCDISRELQDEIIERTEHGGG
ncbi:MAG: glycyl radical protein [Thermoanaerobaculales bacterium]|jgi:formate C-acetyltransferase|nr:glycyl radical protein [Thermoanaerobaculales bacterium]